MFPERTAQHTRFEIPAGCFDCGFCHSVSAHRTHLLRAICRALKLFSNNHRREKGCDCRPRGFGPLLAIERSFPGGTLAPSFRAVFVRHTDKQNAPGGSASETGLEEMN